MLDLLFFIIISISRVKDNQYLMVDKEGKIHNKEEGNNSIKMHQIRDSKGNSQDNNKEQEEEHETHA